MMLKRETWELIFMRRTHSINSRFGTLFIFICIFSPFTRFLLCKWQLYLSFLKLKAQVLWISFMHSLSSSLRTEQRVRLQWRHNNPPLSLFSIILSLKPPECLCPCLVVTRVWWWWLDVEEVINWPETTAITSHHSHHLLSTTTWSRYERQKMIEVQFCLNIQ